MRHMKVDRGEAALLSFRFGLGQDEQVVTRRTVSEQEDAESAKGEFSVRVTSFLLLTDRSEDPQSPRFLLYKRLKGMLLESSEKGGDYATSLEFLACQPNEQGRPWSEPAPSGFNALQREYLERMLFSEDDMYYVMRLSQVSWLIIEVNCSPSDVSTA